MLDSGTHIALNDQNNNISIVQQYEGFALGIVNEKGSFLGNVADSELMKVNGAETAYLGYSFDNGNLFGSATVGATRLDVDSSSMLKSADIMMSNSATLGIKQTVDSSTFGFVASVPVSITSGKAHFDVPSSVSSDGTINNSQMSSSMEADKREVDFGMFYSFNPSKTTSFTANLELRTNYAGTSDDTIGAGISYKVMF